MLIYDLRKLFPNISRESLQKYKNYMDVLYNPLRMMQNDEESYIRYYNNRYYSPMKYIKKANEYVSESNASDILHKYLGDFVRGHECYQIRFSPSKEINELLSSLVMDTDDLNNDFWTRESIKIAAKYLATEPILLPCFIIENSLNIMSQLMGYKNKSCFNCREEIVGNKDTNMYLTQQFMKSVGLRHLSVFLTLIEELISQGVNLAAFPINGSYYVMNYDTLLCSEPKYENHFNVWKSIVEPKNRAEFAYLKQYDFNIESFFQFRDLPTFLERVLFLIENRPSYSFEFDWSMPNPATIDFKHKNYITPPIHAFYNYLYKRIDKHLKYFECDNPPITFFEPYKNEREKSVVGDTIPLPAYLKKMIRTLKAKEQETRVQLSIVDKAYSYVQYGKGKEEFDLEKMNFQKSGLTSELISMFPAIEKMIEGDYQFKEEELEYINRLKENMEEYVREKEEEDIFSNVNYIKDKIEQYQNEIRNLQEQLSIQKEQSNSLQEQLDTYLQNGGPLSVEVLTNLDKQMMKKLLSQKTGKKSAAYYRRVALISVISSIGLSSLFASNHIFKNFISPNVSNEKQDTSEQGKIDAVHGFGVNNHFLDEKEQSPIDSNPETEDSISKFKPLVLPEKGFIDSRFSVENEEIMIPTLGILENEQGAEIPYYSSALQDKPEGYTNQKGIIIGYFAICNVEGRLECKSFRTQQELDTFLETHSVSDYQWKAAFCTYKNHEELLQMLQNNESISYEYTTFFIDVSLPKQTVKQKVNLKINPVKK